MIESIRGRIQSSETSGVFHDSRKDIYTLSKMINTLIDKCNELIEDNNDLRAEINKLKTND